MLQVLRPCAHAVECGPWLETLVTGLFLSPKRRCSACPGVVIIRTYLVIRQRMFCSVLWLLPKPVTKHAGKNIQRALMEVKTFRPSTRRKHDSSLAIVAAHKGVSASRETNDRCRVQRERWECDLKYRISFESLNYTRTRFSKKRPAKKTVAMFATASSLPYFLPIPLSFQ